MVALGLSLSGAAKADKIAVHLSERENSQIEAPKNGQSMAEIQEIYGAPVQKVAPVGEPPISRWVYPSFTVYFEDDLVLHSVVTKS